MRFAFHNAYSRSGEARPFNITRDAVRRATAPRDAHVTRPRDPTTGYGGPGGLFEHALRLSSIRVGRLSRLIARVATLWGALAGGVTWAAPLTDVVFQDFQNTITAVDSGFNDFSGNTGAINKDAMPYGIRSVQCSSAASCDLRFKWDFSIARDREAYSGLFFSLFGLTDTLVTQDGHVREKLAFNEHSLDLNNIDGTLQEPGGGRSIREFRIRLTYAPRLPLDTLLRIELQDVNGGTRFWRFPLAAANPSSLDITWNFRNEFAIGGAVDADLSKAKKLNLVVEREHLGDHVSNPLLGEIRVHQIAGLLDRPEAEPVDDAALLDLAARRTFQYFLDWTSRKPGSYGMPQDRSTFADLLTVGGVGFALPAHVIGAQRGWITRTQAAQSARAVLELLGNEASFGPDPIGRIGHRGWFYHFLDVFGKRRLNFDFPDTPDNESLNTVELSTIDTGLAIMGVLVAQSYFDGETADEQQIRRLAQQIFDRVDWAFMLEPSRQQFYLGWKPNESRRGPAFLISDSTGEGGFSGTPGAPATLDYYTDEASIITLLAVASDTHGVPASIYCRWIRDRRSGLVRTYPGALFTYQFLHAFLDTNQLNLPACPGEPAVNWYDNSRRAIFATIDYAGTNPLAFSGYDALAGWGLSAAEGPTDHYHAYGAPTVAVNAMPEQDGTVSYYGMMSAVSFGADLRKRAVDVLRTAWARGHWHPRFGLPDAFNGDIAQATLSVDLSGKMCVPRREGEWVQRALFAIDQGPMLLHMENARSGLIWNLLVANPNIQRGLTRLRSGISTARFVVEGESGSGQGQLMYRSEASGQRTVYFQNVGDLRSFEIAVGTPGRYGVSVRYSNDSYLGPLDVVEVIANGAPVGQFTASDTGDGGHGWNEFRVSGRIGTVELPAGSNMLQLRLVTTDNYGVEVDSIIFEPETD